MSSSCHPESYQLDDRIQGALEDISGGPLPDWAWLRSTFSWGGGGGGESSFCSSACPAAYTSSVAESIDFVSEILGYTATLTLWLPSAISSLANSAKITLARALALPSSPPHAGDWLNAIPPTALGLGLLDKSLSFP